MQDITITRMLYIGEFLNAFSSCKQAREELKNRITPYTMRCKLESISDSSSRGLSICILNGKKYLCVPTTDTFTVFEIEYEDSTPLMDYEFVSLASLSFFGTSLLDGIAVLLAEYLLRLLNSSSTSKAVQSSIMYATVKVLDFLFYSISHEGDSDITWLRISSLVQVLSSSTSYKGIELLIKSASNTEVVESSRHTSNFVLLATLRGILVLVSLNRTMDYSYSKLRFLYNTLSTFKDLLDSTDKLDFKLDLKFKESATNCMCTLSKWCSELLLELKNSDKTEEEDNIVPKAEEEVNPVLKDSVTLPTDGKTYSVKELLKGYTCITCKDNVIVRTVPKTYDIEVYVKINDDAFVKIIS